MSKKTSIFTLARPKNGEWQALYVNGKKVTENHCIDAAHALQQASYVEGMRLDLVDVPVGLAEVGTWPYTLTELMQRIERGSK